MPPIRFRLEVTGPTTAYVRLAEAAPGTIARTVSLCDLVGAYKGPAVTLDFDGSGELVGIELIRDDDLPDEWGETDEQPRDRGGDDTRDPPN